jgi:hypothetical protein
MATAASTGWEILRLILSLCLFASAAGYIGGLLRGQRSIRDERGRLKPTPAILASFAVLVAVGVVVALVEQGAG